jgi:glutaredoxin 3
VYTTSSCPHCRRAKEFLDARGVAYVERRIDEDASAQRELAARGRMVVPTFVVDDDVQAGLDARGVLLEQLLRRHGLL